MTARGPRTIGEAIVFQWREHRGGGVPPVVAPHGPVREVVRHPDARAGFHPGMSPMDHDERKAWDDAVERATCLDSRATVEVPVDLLIAVDAEYSPGSTPGVPSMASTVAIVILILVGFAIGLAIGAVITGGYMPVAGG